MVIKNQSRPKFLSLFTLAPRMSITAKVSILHRLSGVMLFLAIPVLLYLFHKSQVSPSFYQALYHLSSCIWMKVFYVFLIWAFIYHAVSGVRFLLLDVSVGVEIKRAKNTARLVLLISTILTIGLGVLLW